MEEDVDVEDLDRRQLARAEEIRRALVRKRNTITDLEERLARALIAQEREREENGKLRLALQQAKRSGAQALARNAELEEQCKRQGVDLARLAQVEENLKKDLHQASAGEERAQTRLRHLEIHCAELSSKQTQTCETNLNLLREIAWLKTALESKEHEAVDLNAEYQAKLQVLQAELKEKTCEVFELENELHGTAYKYEREMLKMEKEADFQVAIANDHASEAHRVLEQRERRAMQILQSKHEWKQQREQLKNRVYCLQMNRDWAFALLGAVHCGEEKKKPVAAAAAARFKRVARAVLFACSLLLRIHPRSSSSNSNKSRPITTNVLGFAWRAQDVLGESLHSFTLKMQQMHSDVQRIAEYKLQAKTATELELELRKRALEAEDFKQSFSQSMGAITALQSKLKQAREQSLASERAAERLALQAESTERELERALREHKESQDVLGRTCAQLETKLAKQTNKLRHYQALLQQEQTCALRLRAQVHELELELEASKEMLERTRRYAEAEIASLTGMIT